MSENSFGRGFMIINMAWRLVETVESYSRYLSRIRRCSFALYLKHPSPLCSDETKKWKDKLSTRLTQAKGRGEKEAAY